MKKQRHIALFATCLLAILAIAASVVVRVYLEEAAGRKAARDSFSRLTSILAPVRTTSDLASPGIRADLMRFYRDSPALLLVSIYERGSGVRWRVPARSDYLPQTENASFIPQPDYPPQSAFLLAAALPGDVTGKLAVDGLYVILPQARMFGFFRDAGLGLAGLILLLAFVLLGQTIADRRLKAGEMAVAAPLPDYESSYQPGQEAPMEKNEEESIYSAPTEEDFEVPELSDQAPSFQPGPRPGAAPETEERAGNAEKAAPGGLFSPLSGLGWESYLENRLDAELARAASFEQDLCLLVIHGEGLSPERSDYGTTARTIGDFFSFRDLAFERGPDGFAVILPNMDADHGLRMAEEFRKKLNQAFTGRRDRAGGPVLNMGLSSRAGRLVDSGRVCKEADLALRKAATDTESHIMAFRPDPDRYRLYLAGKGL